MCDDIATVAALSLLAFVAKKVRSVGLEGFHLTRGGHLGALFGPGMRLYLRHKYFFGGAKIHRPAD